MCIRDHDYVTWHVSLSVHFKCAVSKVIERQRQTDWLYYGAHFDVKARRGGQSNGMRESKGRESRKDTEREIHIGTRIYIYIYTSSSSDTVLVWRTVLPTSWPWPCRVWVVCKRSPDALLGSARLGRPPASSASWPAAGLLVASPVRDGERWWNETVGSCTGGRGGPERRL